MRNAAIAVHPVQPVPMGPDLREKLPAYSLESSAETVRERSA